MVAFVKGAPKEVLALSSCLRLSGQDVLLDAAQRQTVMEVNDRMARGGMRVLAVAQRRLPQDFDDYRAEGSNAI